MPLTATVSASSANLGPGFDCLGLAIDLDLVVHARPADRDRYDYRGDGAVDAGPDNPVHRGFRAAFAALGRPAPPVHLEAENPIPLARGLGSSSAALVAGAMLGDAAAGGGLGLDGAFQLTADLEGHPDNVAPALFGGLAVCARDDARWMARILPWPPSWRLLYGVPAFELKTEEARALLPDRIDRSEAVLTAGRVSFWPLAVLRDDPDLLRFASRDVTHEPYRHPLLPGFAEAQADLRAAGAYAAYLSGAGPTLGVVCAASDVSACSERLLAYAGPNGRVLEPSIGRGARVSGAWAPVAARS
ncbi:MAG: homoserine kinase [Trueperaceae bacterium]